MLAEFFFAFTWNETKSRPRSMTLRKEFGQYADILTEQACLLKDLLYGQKENFLLRDQRWKSLAGEIDPSFPLG